MTGRKTLYAFEKPRAFNAHVLKFTFASLQEQKSGCAHETHYHGNINKY
jgi:hypothetical protein